MIQYVKNISTSVVEGKVDDVDTAVAVVQSTVNGITAHTISCAPNGSLKEPGSTGVPSVVNVRKAMDPNTFGAWTQVDASVAQDCYLALVYLGMKNNSNYDSETGVNFCLELGMGAAGSEVTFYRKSFTLFKRATDDDPIMNQFVFTLPMPIFIPETTRISGRISGVTQYWNTDDHKLSIQYLVNP